MKEANDCGPLGVPGMHFDIPKQPQAMAPGHAPSERQGLRRATPSAPGTHRPCPAPPWDMQCHDLGRTLQPPGLQAAFFSQM